MVFGQSYDVQDKRHFPSITYNFSMFQQKYLTFILRNSQNVNVLNLLQIEDICTTLSVENTFQKIFTIDIFLPYSL